MKCSHLFAAGAVLLILAAGANSAELLLAARYAAPVERYGHFAIGRPHEYARIEATTSSGRSVGLTLAEDEVFEDLAPRVVKLGAQEPDELLAIVSRRNAGARLVLIGLRGDALVMGAQSVAIGTPMRWLNPVGVADLDGDGQAEIAAVITPHLGGPLKVYQRRGQDLVEVAALGGFSNHVYGATELRLSLTVSTAAGMRLLVPDATRMRLRLIAFVDGRLAETGHCVLASPVVGAIRVASAQLIEVGLATGPITVRLSDCTRAPP